MQTGMGMDLREFWQKVRALEAELSQPGRPRAVALVSLSEEYAGGRSGAFPRGGQFVEAEPFLAAQCLVKQTHRLATDEEIAAQIAKNVQERADFVRTHLARQGIVQVAIDDLGDDE